MCCCFFFVDTLLRCSFNKLLLQKEELEQKHVHLLQVVESEKTAKWQYTQQCEELASEIRKLRAEVSGKFNKLFFNLIRSELKGYWIYIFKTTEPQPVLCVHIAYSE